MAAKKRRPPTTPEGRESLLVSMAYDAAEKLMEEGKASSQIILHFLKIGSINAMCKLEKLKQETALMAAKQQSLEAEQRSEEKYNEALRAMRLYSGQGDDDNYSDLR